jgi:hypothetical protein
MPDHVDDAADHPPVVYPPQPTLHRESGLKATHLRSRQHWQLRHLDPPETVGRITSGSHRKEPDPNFTVDFRRDSRADVITRIPNEELLAAVTLLSVYNHSESDHSQDRVGLNLRLSVLKWIPGSIV